MNRAESERSASDLLPRLAELAGAVLACMGTSATSWGSSTLALLTENVGSLVADVHQKLLQFVDHFVHSVEYVQLMVVVGSKE